MKAAWGYVRLSQSGREGSIDDQREAIRDYAGEADDLQLETTRNDGECASGYEADRQEYRLIREKIEREEIDAVVVRDRARLSRDFDERLRLIVLFRLTEVECHVVEAGGRIAVEDTQTAGMECMHAMMDDMKKRQEIERSRAATDERLEEGYDHGRPKFGMTYDDAGKFQVPGENFEAVVGIFERADTGLGAGEIADQMDLDEPKVRRVLKRREWYAERSREVEVR